MPKIFLCYRREDSRWPAQWIYNDLVDHFGSEAVVFDIDTIPLGADFRKYLNKEVSRCDIFLAVIGDRWLEILKQRLNQPNDFVRIEIQAALEREIPVVPILVGGRSVPNEKDLPPELARLAYKQAAEVRTGPDLQTHLKRLISSLERLLPVRKTEEEFRQNAVLDSPTRKKFKIIPKNNVFRPHAFLGDGRVDKNTHFTVDFDFINNRDEAILLNQPEINVLKTNNDLLDNKPAAIHFKHYPGPTKNWVFPYLIEKKFRILMRCEIDVEITNNDPMHFSEKLNSLESYEIEFQFAHEDMTASTSVERIIIQGTYDDFKKEVLNYWKEMNKTDLIAKATISE
jgi:hypothetical protein